jgi:hypothetical protein
MDDGKGNRKYFCTTAAGATIRANDDWHFCQGPFASRQLCLERAAIANTNYTLVNCGPRASSPIKKVTLETSTDTKQWAVAATLVTDEDSFGFAVMLTANSTNGLSEAEMTQVRECTIVQGGGGNGPMVFYRMKVEEQ